MIKTKSYLANGLAIAALLGVGFAQNALRSTVANHQQFTPQSRTSYFGAYLDHRIVHRLLGTRLLIADLIWIDTLIKADTTWEKNAYGDFYKAFRNITLLDPDNLHAYYVGGMYLSVIKNDVKGATAILRDGVKYLEEKKVDVRSAWSLPFALGYNLLFEEQEVEEGSRWIRRASQYPNCPDYVKVLGEHLSTEVGRLEIAARVLSDLYKRVTRDDEKKRVEDKMVEISVRQELADLNEKYKQFLTSTAAYAHAHDRAFKLFLRSINHPDKNLKGEKLGIGSDGRIGILGR